MRGGGLGGGEVVGGISAGEEEGVSAPGRRGGGGGVSGMFSEGIIEPVESGFGAVELGAADRTGPGGAGSDVAALSDPGRTAARESDMLSFVFVLRFGIST